LKAKEKDINILVNLNKNHSIITDNQILNILLKNIIENAINYTLPHTIVSIDFYVTLSENVIIVKDEGPGMSSDILQMVNAGVYPKSKDGYGIGLSIALNMVQFLKGKIQFIPVITGGTEVKIQLPLNEPSTALKLQNEILGYK
jgi:two-component system sensor histidine kinase QseC